ncbi:MAG: SOS response-associated peptidase family protein [Coprobacillus sp.]
MCGRYYIDDDTYQDVSSLVEEDNFEGDHDKDFCPGEYIPVIVKKDNHYIIHSYRWGFNMQQSLVINARSETIHEKSLFKEHIKNHRCLIPSKGFYEWDTHKRKFSFESNDASYMLGIYREVEKDVVIITTQASKIMKPIHSRMPVIILKEDIDLWFDDLQYEELLNKQIEELKIIDGIMQQSLF